MNSERVLRQATRTRDSRPASERIAQLEEEVTALRAEVARLRLVVGRKRAQFEARVGAELVAGVRELRGERP